MMRESTRSTLRRVGRHEIAYSGILLVVCIILANVGMIHWSTLPFALIPSAIGGMLYGVSYAPIGTVKPKPIAAKMQPYTRSPSIDQCPVCGISDLAEYRYKDAFLELTGIDRYIQKWGERDAHWSCVITCPYEPTAEEIYDGDHKAGKHDSYPVPECEACDRKRQWREIDLDDRTNTIPGCHCRRCIDRLFLPGSGLRMRDMTHMWESDEYHYEHMAAQSSPGSVRYAYAMEKLEKLSKGKK